MSVNTPKNVWYGNVCYSYRGLWLQYSGNMLWSTLVYVQDDFGNLVVV